jgi:nucleoside-diphosphate-sugar epimerase
VYSSRVHWSIIGCGYTGTHLVHALQQLGATITITRRDAAVAAELAQQLGVTGVGADLAQRGSFAVPPGAIVVCSAPPAGVPGGEIANLIAGCAGASRLVYLSSTGVYGPARGAWVDESAPIAPITESGRARALAEAALVHATLPTVTLRIAGIYGPGRGLAARIRAGTYRVIGDGTSHVSRIHVADLVTAILRAGTTGVVGPVNVADDDPAPIGAVADAVAAQLGVAPPPRVPVESVSPEVAGMLTADRKIANRRMHDELGVALRYPSWRDGLAAELAG